MRQNLLIPRNDEIGEPTSNVIAPSTSGEIEMLLAILESYSRFKLPEDSLDAQAIPDDTVRDNIPGVIDWLSEFEKTNGLPEAYLTEEQTKAVFEALDWGQKLKDVPRKSPEFTGDNRKLAAKNSVYLLQLDRQNRIAAIRAAKLNGILMVFGIGVDSSIERIERVPDGEGTALSVDVNSTVVRQSTLLG